MKTVLVTSLRGRPLKRYKHHSLGTVATLGLGRGIFQFHGIVIKGPPARPMHRGYHVPAVPNWGRKVRAPAVRLTAALFGRDIVSPASVQHARRTFVTGGEPPAPTTEPEPPDSGALPTLPDSGVAPTLLDSAAMPTLLDAGALLTVWESGPVPTPLEAGAVPTRPDSSGAPTLLDSGVVPEPLNSGAEPEPLDEEVTPTEHARSA